MFVGVHIKDIKRELRDLLLFQRLNHQRLRIDKGVKTSSISSLEDRTIGRLRTKPCEVSRSMRADSFYQRCKTRVSRAGNARPASSGEKFVGVWY